MTASSNAQTVISRFPSFIEFSQNYAGNISVKLQKPRIWKEITCKESFDKAKAAFSALSCNQAFNLIARYSPRCYARLHYVTSGQRALTLMACPSARLSARVPSWACN